MRLAALLMLCLATPATAETLLTPADLAPADAVFPCHRAGPGPEFWRCLASAGVPQGGIAFARRAETLLDTGPAIPLALTETGIVDLAEVTFPFLANTNDQILLVNGVTPVISPLQLAAEHGLGTQPDASGLGLLAAHPQASPALRLRLTGVRSSGTQQRFVFADTITDGCRACAPVAISLFALDFDAGNLTGSTALGWASVTLADDERRAEAIRHGDPAAEALALAMRGYAPGRLDGTETARLGEARAAFAADHCLDEATAAAQLTRPAPNLPEPSCR